MAPRALVPLLLPLVAAACSADPCPAEKRYLSQPTVLTVLAPDGEPLCDADVSTPTKDLPPFVDCTYLWAGWDLEDAGVVDIAVHASGVDYVGTVELPVGDRDACGDLENPQLEANVEPAP